MPNGASDSDIARNQILYGVLGETNPHSSCAHGNGKHSQSARGERQVTPGSGVHDKGCHTYSMIKHIS
jgi:hypothetical protein